MPKNPLFNYIKSHINETRKTNLEISKKTDSQGCDYFLFDLSNEPSKFSDEAQQYSRTAHHLSVYQTEYEKIPVLSQYHYTAYFVDEKESLYQLHVYFDAKDKATKVIFSRQDKARGYLQVTNLAELDEQFIELANSAIGPIMSPLRKELAEKVGTLEKNYHDSEEKACNFSKDLENNPKEYLKALGRVKEALAQLAPLVPHHYYEKIKDFISQLKSYVEQHSLPIQTISPSKNKEKSTIPSTRNAKLPIHNQSIFKKPRNAFSVESLIATFSTEIKNLTSALQKASGTDDENQVKVLTDIDIKINGLFLTIEDKKVLPPLDLLKQLKALHSEVHQRGESLFNTLLSEKKFTLAAQLPSFHHLLNTKLLNQALETRDSELLDFLLIYGQFAINNQPIKIKSGRYPSAVHCCFKQEAPNRSMQDCLAVLLKHGASLAVKGDNGLPLAHTILSTPDHPLMAALWASPSQTLGSLYKQLIAALNRYLSENTLDEKQREEILLSIKTYKFTISDLSKRTNNLIPGRYKTQQALKNQNLTGCSWPKLKISEKLRKNPEFIELLGALEKEALTYLQKTPAGQFEQWDDKLTKLFRAIDENINDYLKNKDNTLSDEELMQADIDYMKVLLSLFQKVNRLLDIQDELKKSHYANSNKIPARKKDLLKEAKTLSEEINWIRNNNNFTFLSDFQQTIEPSKKDLESLKNLEFLKKVKEETEFIQRLLLEFQRVTLPTLPTLLSSQSIFSDRPDLPNNSTDKSLEEGEEEDKETGANSINPNGPF